MWHIKGCSVQDAAFSGRLVLFGLLRGRKADSVSGVRFSRRLP